ncbi:MAG: gliding motility-associated ABC transporter substrate-binding protein GldG [Bryobacter sp.]
MANISRQQKYGAFTTVYILIVLAALAGLNYLVLKNNKTYDTTSNKRYSLSEQTIKIVKGLQQEVSISYWDEQQSFRSARDLLTLYTNLSSKLKVEYNDAVKKPALARSAGVSTLGTIIVESGDRREQANALTEEQITSAIIRVLKGTTRTVCITQGAGERDLEKTARDGYTAIKELIEKDNFKLQTLNLLEKAEIPATCTVTLVPGPKFDYPTEAVAVLKKTVESGGRVLFMLDPPFNVDKFKVSENKALLDLLAGWGVTANKDLVVDLSRVGQMMGGAVLVNKYENHPIVREMGKTPTVMGFARSLEAKSTDKASVEKLFSSLSTSYSMKDLTKAELEPDPDKDPPGPFLMAVAGTYNTGDEKKPGRFVVVGNASFVENGYVRLYGNVDLLLNMVNWLTADEELISIRPKDPEDRRIQLDQGQLGTLIVVSQFVLPGMALAAAILIWRKRR